MTEPDKSFDDEVTDAYIRKIQGSPLPTPKRLKPMTEPEPDPYLSISCRCKYTAPFDYFTKTALGPLPDGEYQCPSCKWAWTVKREPGKHYPGGLYIPGPATIKEINPQL